MRKKLLFSILFAIGIIVILTLTQLRFDIPKADLIKKYAPPPSSFITIENQDLHFRDEGSGFPLVLIHGTSSSLHTWDVWTEKLKDEFRVIRMDIPAFGLTGPNENHDYSLSAYVDFVDRFLNALHIDSCHIAGNSLGGGIAWAYALKHPEKTGKLILIDPIGYATNKPPTLGFRLAATPVVKELIRYITPRFMYEQSLREVYADTSKITESLIDRYYELSLAPGNRDAFIARMNAPVENVAWNISQIKQPVLLMWGEKDQWIPASHVDSFRAAIPHLSSIVYENVGHIPMEEIPEQTAADAKRFLIE